MKFDDTGNKCENKKEEGWGWDHEENAEKWVKLVNFSNEIRHFMSEGAEHQPHMKGEKV